MERPIYYVFLCLQNGLTPMHLAAQEDKVPVAEILVKYGSQTDTQTKVTYIVDILNYGFANMSLHMRLEYFPLCGTM